MLNLPKSTEVTRQFPKTGLYKQLGWSASQRESFDTDVSRLDFVNWLSPRTMPAIAEGAEIKEIFVVEVQLKRRDFEPKNIDLLGRSIPQRIVWLLRYEDEGKLAVYHDKLFLSDWKTIEKMSVQLAGLNLDAIWQNIVGDIGMFEIEQTKSLSEQIKEDEEREKLLRRISVLEKHMLATKQPRRKREIFLEVNKLKKQLIVSTQSNCAF